MYKSYEFFDNYLLRIGVLSGGSAKSVKKDVAWDERKTKIKSAKLRGKIFSSGGTQARISLNSNELIFCDATWGDRTVEDTVDVTGMLINGSNECLIEVWKVIFIPIEKIGRFSAELIVEYEGETPAFRPWWEKYALPVAVGTGSVVLAGVALSRRGK